MSPPNPTCADCKFRNLALWEYPCSGCYDEYSNTRPLWEAVRRPSPQQTRAKSCLKPS